MEEPGPQKLLCDVEIRSGLFYQQSLVCYFDVGDPEGSHLEVNVRSSASIKMVLKKDFEPGLFDYDATARELEGGEYILTLSRLTKPRLSVGRYYIEITGKAFMKRSNFSILVTFETETDRLLKKTYDEVVVEEVYENQQRVSPFNTFSFEGLTNWPPWSDLKGDPRPCKEDTPLPDFNWFWASDWKISPRPVTGLDGTRVITDSEGWVYCTLWGRGGWTSQPGPTSLVRRRCWKIQRKVKTREMKEKDILRAEVEEPKELEDILNEFAVIDKTPKSVTPGNPRHSLPSSLTTEGVGGHDYLFKSSVSLSSGSIMAYRAPICIDEVRERLGLKEAVAKALQNPYPSLTASSSSIPTSPQTLRNSTPSPSQTYSLQASPSPSSSFSSSSLMALSSASATGSASSSLNSSSNYVTANNSLSNSGANIPTSSSFSTLPDYQDSSSVSPSSSSSSLLSTSGGGLTKSTILEQVQLRQHQREQELQQRLEERKKQREEARKKKELEDKKEMEAKRRREEEEKKKEGELEAFEASLRSQIEEESRRFAELQATIRLQRTQRGLFANE